MAEKNWRPFPLHVYENEGGDRFVLPGDREFMFLEENIRSIQTDIDTLRAKKDADRADSTQKLLEREQERLILLKKTTDGFKEKSELHKFEMATPSFTQYLDAEEEAKTWVVGEPRVNEGKFAKRLLAGNVRKDGVVLDESSIGELEPMIAVKLWEEMKTKVRPNIERLPFLSSPSQKPLKAN